jgi:hypothetical protein
LFIEARFLAAVDFVKIRALRDQKILNVGRDKGIVRFCLFDVILELEGHPPAVFAVS